MQPYSEDYLKRFKWQDERGRYRKTLLKTYSDETLHRLAAEDRLIHPTRRGAKYSYKQYLDESPGERQHDDVWTDIHMINPVARERLGDPTQKPEALLERIIAASSDPGDIVLDPFCGCGTTLAVAQRLGRQWIGVDISPTAVELMKRRIIKATHGSVLPKLIGMPVTEAELRELKPFEFQNWVIQRLNGTHSSRRTGDMGIDGLSFMTHDPIQVKQSDRVGRNVVDNFETAMRRVGKDKGYIVALSFGRGAKDEVARVRHAEGLDIELVTVADLLAQEPAPASVTGLPLPKARPREARPSATDLVRSDREVG